MVQEDSAPIFADCLIVAEDVLKADPRLQRFADIQREDGRGLAYRRRQAADKSPNAEDAPCQPMSPR